MAAPRVEWALALHGGAGVITPGSTDAETYYQALTQALELGASMLEDGAAAIETVEAVVVLLEDDPKFNAGRGAVFTNQGTHELDAAIMDGRTLSCGAVTGLRNVRNPISLARAVMEHSEHVLLAGDGADAFARELGVRRVPQNYFFTQQRFDEWQQEVRDQRRREREARRPQSTPPAPATPAQRERPESGQPPPARELGTVGAVVLDRYGNLAAGTSTGGLTNKRFGRIGDVPIIGAGTYAKNATAAISCTGKGEQFIRHTVAHEISALIEHRGLGLVEAAERVLHRTLLKGDGGMIGVAADGTIAMVWNTDGMFRGAADSRGRFEVGIWSETKGRVARPTGTPPAPAQTPRATGTSHDQTP
jgi:beta-aspartyl-peptidase (threonine type)